MARQSSNFGTASLTRAADLAGRPLASQKGPSKKSNIVDASAAARRLNCQIDNSGKWWRTEEKVSILREPVLSSEIPVLLSNPRTFRKYDQSCIARQCTVTRRFHRAYLSHRKRKRIEVHSESWFDSRRSQSQNRQTSCVMRLVTSKNRAIQKYLETLSGYSILVQLEARSTKRTAILSNKIKRSSSLRHTACRVHCESDMHEDQGSALSKGQRDSETAIILGGTTPERHESKAGDQQVQRGIDDMNQTKIFELCKNSAKHQCLDCKAFSEIGIIYCSAGYI